MGVALEFGVQSYWFRHFVDNVEAVKEGPTQMRKTEHFGEREEVRYTAKGIRFTVMDDTLYATYLGWPND